MEALLALDGNILLFIQDHIRNDFLTPILSTITKIGDFKGLCWIIVCVTLVIIKRTRKAGICVSIALSLSGIITNLTIKNLVGRTRPYDIISGLTVVGDKPHDTSFPSGHASAAFAVSVALLLGLTLIMAKRKAHMIGIALIVLSVIIAFSRLYLGVHFPTDVLTGMILGIIDGIAGFFLGRFIIEKMPENWFYQYEEPGIAEH